MQSGENVEKQAEVVVDRLDREPDRKSSLSPLPCSGACERATGFAIAATIGFLLGALSARFVVLGSVGVMPQGPASFVEDVILLRYTPRTEGQRNVQPD